MKQIYSVVKAFVVRDEGATAIEYGLLAGLISVALIVGATTLGGGINLFFQGLGDRFAGVSVPGGS